MSRDLVALVHLLAAEFRHLCRLPSGQLPVDQRFHRMAGLPYRATLGRRFRASIFHLLQCRGKADFGELVDKHAPAGSGFVGDAAGAIRSPPAAAALAPPPAAATVAAGQAGQQAEQAEQAPQQLTKLQGPSRQGPPQQLATRAIRLAAGEQASGAPRVLGVQPGQTQLVQQKAAQQQRPVLGPQAQQHAQHEPAKQQQPDEVAASGESLESLPASPAAAEPPLPPAADVDAAAGSSAKESAHSAAAIVGGAAGTLAGAAVLLVLYCLSEKKRAGFAALPTTIPRAPWEPALPVSQAAGKLVPIPEGAEEAGP